MSGLFSTPKITTTTSTAVTRATVPDSAAVEAAAKKRRFAEEEKARGRASTSLTKYSGSGSVLGK